MNLTLDPQPQRELSQRSRSIGLKRQDENVTEGRITDRLPKGVHVGASSTVCAHDRTHDGISQPSSFIFRFVQCCSCSNRAGSITTNRRPALPPASVHTSRPFAWISISLSGNRKLTSTSPAKPVGSLTTSSPMPPVLRFTACTCNSFPCAFFRVTEILTLDRKNFC